MISFFIFWDTIIHWDSVFVVTVPIIQAEYEHSCEDRINHLEEENRSKQEKIHQLENQIITLQVGAGV